MLHPHPHSCPNVLGIALVTTLLATPASAEQSVASLGCHPGYLGAADTEVVIIPDGDVQGVTLGPLNVAASGMVTDVVASITMAHGNYGDVTLFLSYDADGDGAVDAAAPLDIHLARASACDGDPMWACPVEVDGSYMFADDPSGNETPLAVFHGLPAGGQWTLTAHDAGKSHVGSISEWSVHLNVTPNSGSKQSPVNSDLAADR